MPRIAELHDDDLLAPGSAIGDFVVESVLGAGTSSVVYRAEQRSLGRSVALKLLTPALADDPAGRALFRERGATAAALEHPFVVPVYEFGEDDGRVFLAMQLISGGPLGARIAGEGLTADETIGALEGVASALDAAHSVGLWHGAVHAGNVLMGDRAAYLADLGVRTAPGGAADDVRALAVLAAECLTGRASSEASSPAPVAQRLPGATDPPALAASAVIERALSIGEPVADAAATDFVGALAAALEALPPARRAARPAFAIL